jgi:hypothetical protein
MTFSPTTPQSQPSPAATQAQIQTNFAEYARIFALNHSAINSSNQGDHEDVILTSQTVDPGVTEDLVVLYCKNATSLSGMQPQLFAQIKKFLPNAADTQNAPNTPMQLTFNVVNTAGPQYQSFLPGGYLLYFGVDSGVTVPNVAIADTIILSPAPTQILLAIAIPNTMTTIGTPIPFTVATAVNTVTNDRFVIHSGGNFNGGAIAYSFTYIVIAKA